MRCGSRGDAATDAGPHRHPLFHALDGAFPTVTALAEAPLEEVLRHWAGLATMRARHLRAAARRVVEYHGGVLGRSRRAAGTPRIGRYRRRHPEHRFGCVPHPGWERDPCLLPALPGRRRPGSARVSAGSGSLPRRWYTGRAKRFQPGDGAGRNRVPSRAPLRGVPAGR